MKIINYGLACLVALGFFAAGCEREEFNPEVNLPRQFKPGDISITAGETEAKLEWDASLFAKPNATYTVEVGTDSSFATPAIFTQVIDTNSIVVTDSILQVMQFYYARVKANQSGSTTESGWVHSSRFRITGEQIFLNIPDADLKDTTVLLKWRPTTGLTSIRITRTGGTATTINLTAADVAANQKLVTGLLPSTSYTAEIFRGTTRKGIITFTTDELNIFHVVLHPGDDIVAAVANANNGDVIGLEPGTYNAVSSTGAYVNLLIQQKTITLQARTGNATNTRVNFKEITLKGTGAGIILKGIEFNGTLANADYFINFTGLAADGDAAVFTKVVVDNSVVKYTNNALIRGNRATANGGHKIDSITIKNSIISDNGTAATFDYILLDKMEFKSLQILNTTIYNGGRRLISWATNFSAPKPVILIDYSTINGFGYGTPRDNVLLDANTNPIDFTLKNSILANTPRTGSVGPSLLRATGAGSSVVISHTNMFNLMTGGTTSVPLTIPAYVTLSNNLNVDLGWTAGTTSFTLPAPPSPVRTASQSGGPIGDPRWW